jgi:uncharacterized delta-60 repeat protein
MPRSNPFLARGALALLLAVLPVAGPARPAAGSPGVPDHNFGDWHTSGSRPAQGHGPHAVQPDGKIVFAGNSGAPLSLTRQLPNGDPDATFGTSGGVTVSYGSISVIPRSVAVQPDGKIVVVGYLDAQPADAFILRFTASGALDASFGANGWRVFDFDSDTDVFEKVLIQPTGNIVAAGWSLIGGDWDFCVARVFTNGNLDNTFNDDGMATIGFGADDKCFDAALQADGKLVLAGESQGTFDDDMAVCRLDVNGHLDTSFSFDGKTTTGFGVDDVADAVAIQPDGKILAGGREKIARYNTDGSLDGSWDGDGKMSVDYVVKDIAVRPDGLIVILAHGLYNGTENWDYHVYARDPDGGTNSSVSGYLGTTTFPQDPAFLSLLPDSRMVAAYRVGVGCNFFRLAPNGASDPDGYQTVALDVPGYPAGSSEIAYALAVQPDLSSILVGQVTYGAQTSLAITRLAPNGTIDPTFGTAGSATLAPMGNASGRAVALQPDGKILVAGYTAGPNWNFLVARYIPAGTRDATFGAAGKNIFDFGSGNDFASAIAVQPDGKILVAGQVFNGARTVFGVCRLSSTGFLDKTFDVDGRQFYEFSVGPTHTLNAMVLQPDGKIVLGGTVGGNFGLVRLNSNGSVDATFGAGGRTLTDLGGTDNLFALARLADGRLVAAGSHSVAGHTTMALTLYSASGVLLVSPSSWPNGVAYVDWPGESSAAFALDVRDDGQVVAAGQVNNKFAWAQLGTTSTNPTVGPIVADFPFASEEVIGGVRFTGCCWVTAAGYEFAGGDYNMMARRFETFASLVDVADPVAAPGATGLRLVGPVPNPVRQGATFTFDLTEARPTRLALYDVAGRLVRTLVDGQLSPGRHGEVWDGASENGARVAPGVYFARLEAGRERARATVIVER